MTQAHTPFRLIVAPPPAEALISQIHICSKELAKSLLHLDIHSAPTSADVIILHLPHLVHVKQKSVHPFQLSKPCVSTLLRCQPILFWYKEECALSKIIKACVISVSSTLLFPYC